MHPNCGFQHHKKNVLYIINSTPRIGSSFRINSYCLQKPQLPYNLSSLTYSSYKMGHRDLSLASNSFPK